MTELEKFYSSFNQDIASANWLKKMDKPKAGLYPGLLRYAWRIQ